MVIFCGFSRFGDVGAGRAPELPQSEIFTDFRRFWKEFLDFSKEILEFLEDLKLGGS